MAEKVMKKVDKPAFESRPDLKKLVFYIVIVPRGHADNILRIFKTTKSSFQLVQFGDGTATSEFKSILGVEGNEKDLVYSLVREDVVPEIKRELDNYFDSNKRNGGIAFTINVKTLIGVRIYKYLTQTVRG